MRIVLFLLPILICSISFGQRDLIICIENISSMAKRTIDSIEIQLANQGSEIIEENQIIKTSTFNNKTSLVTKVLVGTDSTILNIFYNKSDYISITNLAKLKQDTLFLSDLTVYPSYYQKGYYFSKTIFENLTNDEPDFSNYKTEIKCEIESKQKIWQIPDSISITINEKEYLLKVQEKTEEMMVLTGQGRRKSLFARKRKQFTFKEVELDIIRFIKVEL